jgi:hypothetical protein
MKKSIYGYVAASLIAFSGAGAFAQTTSPSAPSDGGSKGNHMGMHHESGKHHDNHRCCGSRDTSGWAMMDKDERSEHREKMRAMKSYDECKAYADAHHAKMMDRAKEKGRTMPSAPRRDACGWLKK